MPGSPVGASCFQAKLSRALLLTCATMAATPEQIRILRREFMTMLTVRMCLLIQRMNPHRFWQASASANIFRSSDGLKMIRIKASAMRAGCTARTSSRFVAGVINLQFVWNWTDHQLISHAVSRPVFPVNFNLGVSGRKTSFCPEPTPRYRIYRAIRQQAIHCWYLWRSHCDCLSPFAVVRAAWRLNAVAARPYIVTRRAYA